MSTPGVPSVDPVDLAARLIRLDSSNPPGGEGECIGLIADLLRRSGVEPRVLAADPARPNVIARIEGRGQAPPLLLYGHVDVVPASEGWRHPPFSGALVDGELWGRGALDMKGGLAMLICAFLRAAQAPTPPPGDLLLAATADEEAGGKHGAAFLVSEHPELFAGVRHAISEFGGYTHHVAGRRLYPIQVAQKSRCLLRLTAHGPSGHPSTPRPQTAIGSLRARSPGSTAVASKRDVTEPVAMMVRAMADGLPSVQAIAVRALLRPRLTDLVLRAAGAQAEDLDPLFRDTVVATVLNGGEAANVIPASASALLDCRLLPGHDAHQLKAELQQLLPPAADIEILEHEPSSRPRVDLAMFDLLAAVLREEDPGGHAFPLVSPGMTDARHFDRLGIQTYGCLPMRLEPGLMPKLLHAVDERVPAAALVAGTAAIGRMIDRYNQVTQS